MSIDPSGSVRPTTVAPGASPRRPVAGAHQVSPAKDVADRGFNPLTVGVLGAGMLGGTLGTVVALETGSFVRGLRWGGPVAAALLAAGLLGAVRSKPEAHAVDPESVALAWVPEGGDPNGRHGIVYEHQRKLGAAIVDTGTALGEGARRGELPLATRSGEVRAFEVLDDAVAFARATPGDQAVLRAGGGTGPRWIVPDVVLTADPVTSQQEFRRELLVPPGTTIVPGAEKTPADWLRSVPYGVDALDSDYSREEMPLVEYAGSELVAAEGARQRPDVHVRYLVGRPD